MESIIEKIWDACGGSKASNNKQDIKNFSDKLTIH